MKNRFAPVALSLIVILSSLGAASRSQTPAPVFVLTHLTVVDVVAGAIRPDQTIVLTGDRITAIGASEQITPPQGATVIDEAGKYVIPGLWDMHVHLRDKVYLSLFTANGVTGIRQMSGDSVMLGWRREIERGSLVGPRLIVSSPIIDGPVTRWGGQAYAVTNGSEGRSAVRKAKEWGADFVGVSSLLPRDAYLAVAGEAKAQGISCAGDVPWSLSAAEASDAGQKSIESLTGVVLGCSAAENNIRKQIPSTSVSTSEVAVDAVALKTYDRIKAAVLFRRFVKNGTWHCPTLTALRSKAYAKDRDFRADPRVRFMPRATRDGWQEQVAALASALGVENVAAARQCFPRYLEVVAAMQRAGVPILAGTDTGAPYCFAGFSLHDELALLVDAGLSPAEALRTATLNPARFLGLAESLGTIDPGKIANLVLLDANPLADIKNTTKIAAVILNGRMFDRNELDRMLRRLKDG